jgi:hypothetical protein
LKLIFSPPHLPPLSISEDLWLRVFLSKEVMEIFGPKKEIVTGDENN